jgi:hypothetical protein
VLYASDSRLGYRLGNAHWVGRELDVPLKNPLIVQAPFGFSADLRHHLQRLDRVLACCCFGVEPTDVGAIKDSVCDVRRLSSCALS